MTTAVTFFVTADAVTFHDGLRYKPGSSYHGLGWKYLKYQLSRKRRLLRVIDVVFVRHFHSFPIL